MMNTVSQSVKMKISSGILIGLLSVSLIGCSTNKGPKKVQVSSVQAEECAMTQGVGETTEFIHKDGPEEHISMGNQVLSQKEQDTYLFAFNRFDVAHHDIASIHAHADYLLKHPEVIIYINGHTDQRGSREYNIALGERRAKAVTQILIARGVPESQIKVVSYGSEKPAVHGSDETSHSKNRRAETVYQ